MGLPQVQQQQYQILNLKDWDPEHAPKYNGENVRLRRKDKINVDEN